MSLKMNSNKREQKRRPKPKDGTVLFCGVCGDRALGYNFDAISCESCKAFFRRNATKDKPFTCSFQGNCKLDAHSRKFCSGCRLNRCFSIGMKKEWILDADQLHLRRKRQSVKRQADSVIQPCSSTSGDLHFDFDGSSRLSFTVLGGSNSENSNASCYNSNVKTELTEACDFGRPPESKGRFLNRSPDQEDLFFKTKDYSEKDNSSKDYSVRDYSVRDFSVKSSSPSTPSSTTHFDMPSYDEHHHHQDDDFQRNQNHLYQHQHHLHHHPRQHQHNPHHQDREQHYQPEHSPQRLNKAGQESSVSLVVSSSTAESSPRAKSTAVPSCAFVPACDIKQEDTAIKESDPQTLLNPYIKESLQTLMEKYNEIFEAPYTVDQAPKLLKKPKSPDQLYNMTDVFIRRLIRFAKHIPEFRSLDQSDQINLLKGGIMEMFVLRSAVSFDRKNSSWPFKMQNANKDSGTSKGALNSSALSTLSPSMVTNHMEFVHAVQALTRKDPIVLMLLFIIDLMSPDRPNVADKVMIYQAQERHSMWLKAYMESIYPQSEAKELYPKLLLKLLDVRSLGEESCKMMMSLQISNLEPLLVEIFDLNQ